MVLLIYPVIHSQTEIAILSKGLGCYPFKRAGFLTHSRVPDIGNIIHDMDALKELDFNYFSLVPIRIHQKGTPNQGYHLKHKSFKLKSSFNPVGPFQLEPVFYSIEQDLHRQKCREPKKKKSQKRNIEQ